MNWKLFPTLSAPMPLQMTLDRLLFEKHSRENVFAPILRIFYSSSPWASVGYAAEKKSGYALTQSGHNLKNVPICRRITGGGTVVHGQDLIFSLFARRQNDFEKFDSVETSYRHLHAGVRLAFKKLGENAEFYQEDPLTSGRDCFLFPVQTDLCIDLKKVAGGAQKRSQDFFLHQESIQPPPRVRRDELELALLDAFQTYFQIEFERDQIDPQILIESENQARTCIIPPSGALAV